MRVTLTLFKISNICLNDMFDIFLPYFGKKEITCDIPILLNYRMQEEIRPFSVLLTYSVGHWRI